MDAKRVAAEAAAELAQPGQIVGLGSGSTAALMIEALGRRGLDIIAVATSSASEKLAKSVGIKIVDPSTVDHIDIAIDGADEVDPHLNLIKGGGGALLREKIIATIADEFVIIVDESKLVEKLGTFGLPLEVIPFAHTHTIRALESLGYRPELRNETSDSGHKIVDLRFHDPIADPENEDRRIRSLPGIVETGLFLGLADRIIVGYADGHTEMTT